jgi:Uma2 family endonuclease
MLSANNTMTSPVHLPRGEQRVIFHDLSWPAYQTLLGVLPNGRSSRLIYDQGRLEITMPLEEHESATRLIEFFIRVLVAELGLKIKTMGSTTLNFPNLDRSVEPDDCYYIQNQPLVAGHKIDLTRDPPPDLVVEVDITHSDIDKLRLYASMGVPEFWRYNGREWQIYQLRDKQYVELERSPTFPLVKKVTLYEFLDACQEDEVAAERVLRAWVRKQRGEKGG